MCAHQNMRNLVNFLAVLWLLPAAVIKFFAIY